MTFRKKISIFTCSGVFALAALSTVHAADHPNLEEGLPAPIEDAYPIPYGGREWQAPLRYDRSDTGEDRTVVEPRYEWGFARNAHFKIGVPLFLGSEEDTNSGDVRLEALYNFNQESRFFPAFAASVRVDAPTGEDSEGVDTSVKLIVSKLLGRSSFYHGLHANAAWFNNADPLPGERDQYNMAALGYTARLSPDTLLVLDVVREEERQEGMTSELAEIGLRRQITPTLVLTGGLGAGLDDQSPDFRVTAGIQYSIGASPRALPSPIRSR